MQGVVRSTLLLAVLTCAVAVPADAQPNGPAAASLRRTVRKHLVAGRIDAALEAAQRSLAEHPDDPAVRDEFVSLHLSLARQMLVEEDFATAGQALAAVVKLVPNHPEAARLGAAIQTAREQVPGRVENARRWIDLEWFAPALNTLRQARALSPAQKDGWTALYVQAAIGAGDDHYFCKNFHEGFYSYDVAVQLGSDPAVRTSPSLVSRWLQSMVHALGRDCDRVAYPPDYWKMVLGKAEATTLKGPEGKTLRAVLRGLALENAGRLDRAAAAYAAVLGTSVGTFDRESIRRNRLAALKRIRRWYDPGLSDRRRGLWTERDSGDWQLLKTAHFRIHHRNRRVARRVADALRFHFERVAGLLGRQPGQIPWQQMCDVYLHPDAAAFRAETGQPSDVKANSLIRRRGRLLARHEIHAHQADPMLLSTSLPHELAHLMQAALVGYQPTLPTINEGLALYVEPPCRHVQFARLFGQLHEPRSVKELLAMGEVHPSDAAFYAESHRLVGVLLPRGGAGLVVDRSLAPLDRPQLADLFAFDGARTLEKAYRGQQTRD